MILLHWLHQLFAGESLFFTPASYGYLCVVTDKKTSTAGQDQQRFLLFGSVIVFSPLLFFCRLFVCIIPQSNQFSMKLYVSNLGFGTGDDGLRKMFEPFGEVISAKVINDRATGRSRGFGFVEMSSREEAESAISKLHGKDFDGRSVSVSEAREKPNRF